MSNNNGKKRKNQPGYEKGQDKLGRTAWLKTIQRASDDVAAEIGMVQDDYLDIMHATAAAKIAGNDEAYEKLLDRSAKVRQTLNDLGRFGMALNENGEGFEEWMDNYLKFKHQAGINSSARKTANLEERYKNMNYPEEVFLDTVNGVNFIIGDKKEFEEAIGYYRDNYKDKVSQEENPYENRNWDDEEEPTIQVSTHEDDEPIDTEDYYDDAHSGKENASHRKNSKDQKKEKPRKREPRDYKKESVLRDMEKRTGVSNFGHTRMTRPIRIGRFVIYMGKDSFQKRFPWVIPSSIALNVGGGLTARLWSQNYEPAMISSMDLPGGLSFRTTPKLKSKRNKGNKENVIPHIDDEIDDDFYNSDQREDVLRKKNNSSLKDRLKDIFSSPVDSKPQRRGNAPRNAPRAQRKESQKEKLQRIQNQKRRNDEVMRQRLEERRREKIRKKERRNRQREEARKAYEYQRRLDDEQFEREFADF